MTGHVLRVARPTANLAAVAAMCAELDVVRVAVS
jgi:hypothetical protein